jgi:type IX secretion system PorP/SprF family membrane protein
MKKSACIWIVLCALFVVQLRAQHYSLFSQYVVNGLVINPAYAGKNEVLDVTATHRRQWISFEGAPVTTAVTLNTPLRKKSDNIGLCFQDDRIGVSSAQLLSGMYAYRFRFGDVKISLGIQAGMSYTRARWDELRKNDAGDLLLVNAQNSSAFFAGAGLYMHNNKFFFGLSDPWLYNTGSTVNRHPLFVTGGYVFSSGTDHQFKPSFLVRRVLGSPAQADFNFSYYYQNRIGIGVSYRMKESVIFIAELNVNQQLKLAYSYDYGIGKLSAYHNGSHEMMLRYYFGYTKEARNPRAFLY